ncbi:MAG UNVERIFIED_CONTAM: hypothetical protein LVR18_37050 [Planctomycetaceae bacterium]
MASGHRCTYVLTSMLGLDDVRCVAIADVQKTRREAGKLLVDKLAGNSECCSSSAICGKCSNGKTLTP